jgi:septation ring formation regulator EzrA
VSWKDVKTLRKSLNIIFDSDMTVDGLESLIQENSAKIREIEENIKKEQITKTVAQKKFETLSKEINSLEDEKQNIIHILESKGVDFLNIKTTGIANGYK